MATELPMRVDLLRGARLADGVTVDVRLRDGLVVDVAARVSST